jgi:hypothetical protein
VKPYFYNTTVNDRLYYLNHMELTSLLEECMPRSIPIYVVDGWKDVVMIRSNKDIARILDL